ncbi:MAG: terminase family protein [Opitutales bacterium]|nr:terminase family protein [Opitutales bacterium]
MDIIIREPFDTFFEYQLEMVNCTTRFRAANCCRQSGKDFTFSGDIVRQAFALPGSGHMIAAPSERQSLDTLEKCKQWAEAFKLVIEDEIDEPVSVGLNSKTIRLSNGSHIRAVPGRPDTVRGFTGSVWLTEVAFFEDPFKTWAAIAPTITNPMGGRKTATIWSTPNGQDAFFYPIFRDAALGKQQTWTTFTNDIYKVNEAWKKRGRGVDIDELRRMINSPEMWAQEYECKFIDRSSILFTYDLIRKVTHHEASINLPAGFLESRDKQCFVGVDIGRKHDLTCIYVLEKVGDIFWTRGITRLRNMPFSEQRDILRYILRSRSVVRCFIDKTGVGAQLAEEMEQEFGTWKVECCAITLAFKNAIFMRLRVGFDDKLLRILGDRLLIESLHSMQQEVSRAGNIRLAAARTEDGHADDAFALALAYEASNDDNASCAAESPRGNALRLSSNKYAQCRNMMI